jgi:fructose-specific phosphotransferase system component IIB
VKIVAVTACPTGVALERPERRDRIRKVEVPVNLVIASPETVFGKR